MPNLINPYRFGAGAGVGDAFIDSVESTLDATSYTFTGHACGTADAARLVVVGIVLSHAGLNRSISSVTIGGSAATMAADTSSGGPIGNMRVSAIYYRAIAAGTTTTTVVTANNPCDSCAIAVWAIYPTSSTPVDAVSDSNASAASLSASNVAITAGGMLVGVSNHNGGGATTFTWSGTDSVSHNVNNVLGDSGNNWSACTVSCSETLTTGDLTASFTSTHNVGIAAASWGP
jgi:hypothetical protein